MDPIGPSRTIQRPPALPGVEIHRGRHPGAGPCGGFHTQFCIGTIHGPLRYHYNGETRERRGQYAILVQANEFRPAQICGELTFEHWHIAPELMRAAAEERGQTGVPRFDREVTEDPRVYHLITRAGAVLATATEALAQQEALTRLLDGVLGEYADRRRAIGDVIAHRAVRGMRDLIQNRYDEELSLDLLSAHAGLNKFYALRAFKREMGVTPHAYQRHLRVEKARQLLRAGNSSTDIAHMLGFCDQSHFVRTFRQMTRRDSISSEHEVVESLMI